MRSRILILVIAGVANTLAAAQPAATQDGVGRFPHVQVNAEQRVVRVACQALRVEAPLEFFCVVAGTSEHEAVLRTFAKPSHIHTALLMLGLEPGQPVTYSQAARKWFPPHGPPLRISVEFTKDGQHVTLPANRLMRSIHAKEPMPPTTWIFAGSRVMPDGVYAADVTGYVVSIVNFDLTVIDVPELASSANETLQWEASLDLLPELGGAVTMIIEPVEGGSTTMPTTRGGDVTTDQALVDRLRQRWQRQVRPNDAALRQAAQAHYDVIMSLRREQQRLIDEADRIERLIDELEREYQQMTTPRPAREK